MSNSNGSSYTFKTKCSKFELSVKHEFLKDCPNPETIDLMELLSKHFVFRHFHNETDYAIKKFRRDAKTGELTMFRAEFWLNGRQLEKEDPAMFERMKHNLEFGNRIQSVVDET